MSKIIKQNFDVHEFLKMLEEAQRNKHNSLNVTHLGFKFEMAVGAIHPFENGGTGRITEILTMPLPENENHYKEFFDHWTVMGEACLAAVEVSDGSLHAIFLCKLKDKNEHFISTDYVGRNLSVCNACGKWLVKQML